MRFLLLSVLVVCVIGIMVPSVFAESAYTMSTYVHPDQKYSIQYPSTWSVEEWDDLLGWNAIFTDSEDWTIEVEIWELGSIPFIDVQSEQERFDGTITGEKLGCLAGGMGYGCRDVEPTGEHGFVTLSSGEVIHSVSYTSVREYPEEHIVGITSTSVDFLCCTNHIYQIIFHIDTTNPANIPNETIFQIKQDMLESFTFLPATTASEPDPKSTQQASSGCGEGTVLVNGACQLASTPKAKSSSMSIEPLYIIIGVVAIGGIIGAIAVARRGSKTPKPAKQELEKYEEKYLAKEKPVKQKPKPAKQKPVEKKETSAFCENCGNTLNPKAKFCGGCGTKV